MTEQSKETALLAAELATQKRNKPKLYGEVNSELRAAQISNDVALRRQLLEQANKSKVTLSDVREVKDRTNRYLAACQEAAVIPTMSGLALAFGYTRQGVYRHIREHEGSESVKYLEVVQGLLEDCLVAAGLGKTADSAVAIFALKNHFAYSDKLEIAPTAPEPPLGRLVEQAELEAKVAADIAFDEEVEYEF